MEDQFLSLLSYVADYPDNGQVIINEKGEPTLKRISKKEGSPTLKALESTITQRLQERNILDILCNVEHWTQWTRHFGPLSGSAVSHIDGKTNLDGSH